MPEKKKDVFVIYEELKNRMLGVSDRNPKGMKGILVSFLPSGEPVNSKDFKHPWKPNMTSPNKVQPPPLPGEDPAIPDTSDIAKRYESLSNTCTLVDNKIRLNEIYQAIENSSTVSQTWELIINAANVIPMDPAQEAFQKRQFKKYFPRLRKTKIDEDGEEVEVDTKEYKAYKQYSDKYDDALQDYATDYMIAMSNRQTAQLWGIMGKKSLRKVDRAWDEWTTLGSKAHIEEAIDNLAAMGSDASAHMIAAAKKKFEAYSIATQGVIPVTSKYVRLFPSNWYEEDAGGWTEYEYEWSKETTDTEVSKTSFAASGGVSVGFWSAKANAKFDKREEHNDKKVNKMSISLSYATVTIDRPWLDTLLFDLGNWFLVGNHKKGAISTGKMDQVFPGTGADTWLPIIPKKFIVIRNLEITSQELVNHFKSLKKEVGAGGSVGYGPFKLSGSYSHSKNTSHFEAEAEGETLRIKGTQIIGWVSHLVQMSPKIDSPKTQSK
jgi:hypothetical protein